MVVVFAIPVVLIAGAAVAAFVSVRFSTLRITSDGVEIRNYPHPPNVVPLHDVARFEEVEAAGNFRSLRPKTGVLVKTDGTRVTVRALTAPEAGTGVDALNARVDALRGGE